MNQEVRYEGTDITSHVISYTRSQNICSGIGIVDITTTFHYVSGDPWDTVLVYEDGNKKGTYNVISLEDSIPDGTTIIHCQDNSLRLVDTFITDSYKITYVSYARYWIEKFLTEAGVSYSFSTTDNGSPIAKDTVLGLNPAYDIIVTLLQQSGWYIYFNKNGTAVVGDLVAGSGTKATIHDTDIINIDSNKNDSKLRNRAVVWGAGNALDNTWTFADVYRHTPWDIDSNDKRTVVLANSSVDSTYFANVLANKMLDEFARLDHIITAQLHGYYDIDLGDKVGVRSKYYHGTALATSISVSVSGENATTTVVLNERCPRLFGFISYGADYVYAGTENHGVWRKLLTGTVWEDYSTSLPSGSTIQDLKIANGTLAIVANNQLYVRYEGDSYWTYVDPGSASDGSNLTNDGVCKACTVNRDTNEIASIWEANDKAYTVRVIGYDVTTVLPILLNDTTVIRANDIDTDDNSLFVALSSPYSGTGYEANLGPFQDETFTSYDMDDWTREFGNTYSDRGTLCSDICWKDGKAYFIKQDLTTTDNFNFYEYNFRGSTVSETVHPTFTITGCTYVGYLAEDPGMTDEIYFVAYIGTTGYVYSYNVTANSLTYRHTFPSGYNENYKYIFFTPTVSATSTSATFGINYYNMITGISGSDSSLYSVTDSTVTVYTMDYYGNQYIAGRAKDKAVFGFIFSHRTTDALDNCTAGTTGSATAHNVEIVTGYIDTSMGVSHHHDILIDASTASSPHTALARYISGAEQVYNPYIAVGVGSYAGSAAIFFQAIRIDYGNWVSCGGTCYPCNYEYENKSSPTTEIAIGYISLGDWTINNGSDSDFDFGLQYNAISGDYSQSSKGFLSNGSMYWKAYEGGLSGSTSDYYFKNLYGSNETLGLGLTRNTEQNLLRYYDYLYNKVYFIGTSGAARYSTLYRYGFTSTTAEATILLESLGTDYDATHCTGYTHNAQLWGASQNVIAIKVTVCDYPSGWGGEYIRFYQFGHLQYISGGWNVTAVETIPHYTVIDVNSVPHQLEASVPGTLLSFPLSPSGQFPYNDNLSLLLTSPDLGTTYSGSTISGTSYSGWVRLASGIVLYDVRDLIFGYGTDVTFSGYVVSGLGNTEILAALNNTISRIPISGGTFTTLDSNILDIGKLETSRMASDPYLFYSVYVPSGVVFSGAVTSGTITSGNGLFYQHLPGGSGFTDVTSGLPLTNVTVIRIDDRV